MCKYVANIVSVNGGAVGNISPINEIHTGQNPARHVTLRGAAARGALTFFRLTREDYGIALNIVWVTNTSGQNPCRPQVYFPPLELIQPKFWAGLFRIKPALKANFV